jgi:SAM-dependent methyltransferase
MESPSAGRRPGTSPFRDFLYRHPPLLRAARGLSNARYTVYHYIDAVAPRATVARAVRGFPRFLRDRRNYVRMSGERLRWHEDNPQLLDWSETSPHDPHYTYQDAWAAGEIAQRRPARHVDIGSRITFVAGLAAFVPVTFIDLRPLEVAIPGLETRRGSILDLPYDDESLESISTLHVAEHIGLGRYGDPLDPQGIVKAADELQRVLAPGGFLYFSVPVGRPRTAFNAHRVLDPVELVQLFPSMRLDGFAGVDDEGVFHAELEPAALAGCEWACGFYRFTKP